MCYILSAASVLISALVLGQTRPSASQPNRSCEEVAQKYAAWRQHLASLPPKPSGEFDFEAVFDNAPFKALVALGPPAVPCLIEKVKTDDLVGHALFRITKYRWHVKRHGPGAGQWIWTVEEFPDLSSAKGPPDDARQLWLRWWQESRQHTRRNFEKAHEQWKSARVAKDAGMTRQAMQYMTDVGIDALPLAIQRIRDGEAELVPLVSSLTDGAVCDSASPASVVAWWEQHKPDWILPETTGGALDR